MNDSNNQNKNRQLFQILRLDLRKYGLSSLAGRHLWDLTSSELDELLDGFAKEDIAPNIGLRAEPKIIGELLNRSYCRGCGKCCQGANTTNPLHPGLEIYEDELKLMGKYAHFSYKSLRKQTRAGQLLRNPSKPNETAKTRWLAFPCMFYDQKMKKCQVYEVRPIVCKIYPITLENSFCVKVNCEYGKDIYRSFVTELKNKARFSFPDLAPKL